MPFAGALRGVLVAAAVMRITVAPQPGSATGLPFFCGHGKASATGTGAVLVLRGTEFPWDARSGCRPAARCGRWIQYGFRPCVQGGSALREPVLWKGPI